MIKTSIIGILMVVGLVSLLMAPPASGQTIAKFNVLFQFVAGDQVLPAGEYRVKVDSSLRRLEIRLAGEDDGAFLAAVPVSTMDIAVTGKLVFSAYGGVRLLQSVWIGGRTERVELPTSKAQRESAKTAGTNLVAMATVEVVAAQ
jgi:hypothetical protein